MARWLLKTEPETFGVDHLKASPNQTTAWEGVRNYQARNFLRAMRKGDLAFFYHSSCKVPGITAIVEVVTEAYPDSTAFDASSLYYDAKSTYVTPRWYRVDVKLVQVMTHIITLESLRANSRLHDMALLKRGNRLSVMPVNEQEWQAILAMQ